MNSFPWVPLRTVAEINPRPDLTNTTDATPVSFLPMSSMGTDGTMELSELRPLASVKKGYTPFMDGDVVFAKITPCMENGKVGVASGLANGIGYGSTEFHVVRPLGGRNPRFYYWLFRRSDFLKDAKSQMKGTAGQKRLPTSYMENTLVPDPLPEEQDRIVARVEELMGGVDAAEADAALAMAQTVLAKVAAVEQAINGTLTGELDGDGWRAAATAEEIAKHVAGRRHGKRVPATLDVSDTLFSDWALPSGWAWTTIEALAADKPSAIKAGPFGSALKKSFYVPDGYKVYGQEQVIRGDAYFGDYFIDEERFTSLKSCAVAPGDILVSLVGTIGRVLILPPDARPGIINPRLVKFSLDPNLVEARYLSIYLQSPTVKRYLLHASHGGTMDVLNLTSFKMLPIALPPLSEQRYILDSLSAANDGLGHVGESLSALGPQVQALRQSILKSAFSGELV